jgi:hypothetical protein
MKLKIEVTVTGPDAERVLDFLEEHLSEEDSDFKWVIGHLLNVMEDDGELFSTGISISKED